MLELIPLPSLLSSRRGNLVGSGIVPVLSSQLAGIDLRLPFVVSAALCVLNLGFMKVALPETLPKERRRAFQWRAASPLSFVTLFRRGARLRLLSTLAIFDLWVAPVAGGYIASPILVIYQADALGWGLMQRGQFESLSAVLSVPGLFVSPWLMRRVGLPSTVRLGILSTAMGLVVNFFARSQWHFYAGVILGCFRSGGTHALNAMIATEGAAVGLGQGELQASIGNFRSVLGTVGGLLWGSIYGAGSRRGHPGLFFLVALASVLVQFASATRPLARDQGNKLRRVE